MTAQTHFSSAIYQTKGETSLKDKYRIYSKSKVASYLWKSFKEDLENHAPFGGLKHL